MLTVFIQDEYYLNIYDQDKNSGNKRPNKE